MIFEIAIIILLVIILSKLSAVKPTKKEQPRAIKIKEVYVGKFLLNPLRNWILFLLLVISVIFLLGYIYSH